MFRPINPNEFEEITLTSSNLLAYNTTNTFNRINTPSPKYYNKEKQKYRLGKSSQFHYRYFLQ